MDRNGIIQVGQARYGAEPEYLWPDSPDAFVFRHAGNRKWFALVMTVPRSRLGLTGEGSADVLNLKCGPMLGGSYRGRPGILPAYHMNKEHWISVVLDGSVPDELAEELLEISYDLTI